MTNSSYYYENSSSVKHVLDERKLDYMANQYAYIKLFDQDYSTAPMASYRRGAVRLDFGLTTGTVNVFLEHTKQNKAALFQREINMKKTAAIFQHARRQNNLQA